MRAIDLFLGRMASYLVRGYQMFISPLMPPSCRYFPSCSEYSRVSLIRHGLVRGLWLTTTRILRCNPWTQGGWDPVPPLPGQPDDPPEMYAKYKPGIHNDKRIK